MAAGEGSISPVDGPTPMHTLPAPSGLNGKTDKQTKEYMKLGGRYGGERVGGE